MAAILTSVLVLLGIFVLMSKGGLPSGGRSRLVLHYPASGPSPVALLELTDVSVILDRRLAKLWQRRASLADAAERALLAQIEALGTTDLRVGDSGGSSFTPPRPQMLPLSIKVKSPEYAAIGTSLAHSGPPTQVRNCLAYVLNNWKHHGESASSLRRDWPVDPYSTASVFDGWKEIDGRRMVTPSGYDGPLVWWPKTWLLGEGWRKRGLISMHFVPNGDE